LAASIKVAGYFFSGCICPWLWWLVVVIDYVSVEVVVDCVLVELVGDCGPCWCLLVFSWWLLALSGCRQ
jgi:hypothetical protein